VTIIEAVCKLHGITPAEFYGRSTTKRIVAARKDAIDALRVKNLSVDAIARIMRRNRSTIQYWVYPGIHERRITNYLKRYQKKKALRSPRSMEMLAA
jgi:transposase